MPPLIYSLNMSHFRHESRSEGGESRLGRRSSLGDFLINSGARIALLAALGGCAVAPNPQATPGAQSNPEPEEDTIEIMVRQLGQRMEECKKIKDPSSRVFELSRIESDLANLRSNSAQAKSLRKNVWGALDTATDEIRMMNGGRKLPEKGENNEGKPYENITATHIENGRVTVIDLQRDDGGTFCNGRPISEEVYEATKAEMKRRR